jgi:hypothetical protein
MIHPSQQGIDGVTGAEVADGEVECTKAVRRQISTGADVIKVQCCSILAWACRG